MLQNKLESKTEQLNCISNQIQSSIKQIDQAVEFANNLVQSSASSDIMQSKKNLVRRFKDLGETPVPALPVSSFVKFVSTVAPKSLNLGFVATSEIDAHRSTVQKITENLQAGLEAVFQDPVSVCMDNEGRVVVTEYYNNRIQVLTKDGKSVFKFGDSGSEKLYKPTGCVNHQDMFIVSDCWNHCLKVFDSSGTFLYKIGQKGDANGQFSYPWGLLVEKYGNRQNLLVCDRHNGRIQQFTVEGCFTGKTVTSLQKPTDIATTPDGRILVSEAVLEQLKGASEENHDGNGNVVQKFNEENNGCTSAL